MLLRLEAFRNEELCGSNYPSPILLLPALPYPGSVDFGVLSEALSRSLDMILPFLEVNQISAADRGNFLPDIGALALAKKIPRALRSPSPTGGVDST